MSSAVDVQAQRSAAARRIVSQAIPYLVAVVAAFVIVAILMLALGHNPFVAFETVLTNSFKNQTGIVQTLKKWVPLTLLALAFAVPLAAGRFNIGGEGQMILGAFGAVSVGITLSDLPAVILIPLAIIAGVLAGALWAGIAAWLMQQFKVNEILSTVLLNFVSFEILDYFAATVWPDPGAGGTVTTPIGSNAELATVGRPPMHIGVFLTILVAIAAAVVAKRSVSGFELRAVGLNERASKIHGIRVGKVAVGSLIAGGALAGLAGAIEVTGVHHNMQEGMQANFLLLGIIIGLIARGSLVAVPFVALGIAVLEVGAGAMQRTSGVPVEMIQILEGLILILLLMSDYVTARLRRRADRRAAA